MPLVDPTGSMQHRQWAAVTDSAFVTAATFAAMGKHLVRRNIENGGEGDDQMTLGD